MNNLKFFAFLVFILLAASNISAHDDFILNYDDVPKDSMNIVDSTDYYVDVFDSEQYNKWTKSANFVKGIEQMNNASLTTNDNNDNIDDETSGYKKAITFFQKELKQHPKNGYAKCNIAMCKHHIASITLNKYLLSVFDNEMMDPNYNDTFMALEDEYEEKLKEKEKDVRETIKTLDEGLAMMPAADKETKCQVLIKKYEMLKDIDASSDELLECLTQATKIHPCENSYLCLVNYLAYNYNEDDATSKDMLNKYIEEAATVIPDYPIVKYYTAANEYNNKNYEKALELTNQLCADNPDDSDNLKLRASINVKLHNYKNAIDDVITLANNGYINYPYNILSYIIDLDKKNNLPLALDAVREQQKKKMFSPDEVMEEVEVDKTGAYLEGTPINWHLVEGKIHDKISHDYNKALECTQKSLEKNKLNEEKLDPAALSYMGEMYYKLGKVDKALVVLDEAAKRAGSFYSSDAIQKMIDIESNCGMSDRVINDTQVLKTIYGESSYCYSLLGWAYGAKGDWTNAIKAYDQWIELDESSIIAKIMKGRALIFSGDDEDGRELMKQVLDNSDFTNREEYKMYTLYYLGRTSESKAILDRLVANTQEVMNMTSEEKAEKDVLPEVLTLYDIACWYSLHGDSEKAFQYLKLNYETDSESPLCFDYAILDYDFDNVRNNPEFINIINEYKTRWLKGEYKPVR